MPSRYDPLGLADLAGSALRTGLQVAGWGERRLRGLLGPQGAEAVPQVDEPETLAAKLRRLLDGGLRDSRVSARQELFSKILDQLVPDEARILELLSDGSTAPLVHVYAVTETGLVGEVVLENMSPVGRAANLTLPHLTPAYTSHLLSLGLLETGPEDASLEAEYAVLADDPAVQRAVKRGSRDQQPARVERHTLRLSGLGRDLWAAAS